MRRGPFLVPVSTLPALPDTNVLQGRRALEEKVERLVDLRDVEGEGGKKFKGRGTGAAFFIFHSVVAEAVAKEYVGILISYSSTPTAAFPATFVTRRSEVHEMKLLQVIVATIARVDEASALWQKKKNKKRKREEEEGV